MKQRKKSNISFPFVVELTRDEISIIAKNTCAQFKLNADQERVIERCTKWFVPPLPKDIEKGAWSQDLTAVSALPSHTLMKRKEGRRHSLFHLSAPVIITRACLLCASFK